MTATGVRRAVLLAAALAVLAGCATDHPAPVVDRSIAPAKREPERPPEHYEVRRGDTLYSIAFRYGLDFKTLARWNDIEPPYTIYPGQRLRFEPGAPGNGAERTQPARTADAGVKSEPLPEESGRPARPAPREERKADPAPRPEPEEPEPAESTARPRADTSPTPSDGGPLRWQWPADGEILATFAPGDSSRNGIDIGGESGAPVEAAADGTVVYSGSGLIGYGELIIVKHDNALLSAYGHNRKRLVQEGDQVQAGQRIAEMGQTGAPRPMLHFEIREDGTPVDPMKYLPRR